MWPEQPPEDLKLNQMTNNSKFEPWNIFSLEHVTRELQRDRYEVLTLGPWPLQSVRRWRMVQNKN